MFNAKVYTVSIPSSGVVLEEEHIAREVISKWNIENGERHGMVFLTLLNNYGGITPDIYIFAIDNYVDEQKVVSAIQTGAKVMLFIRSHHNEKDTIESELKKIDAFRECIKDKCTVIDYMYSGMFEDALWAELSSLY